MELRLARIPQTFRNIQRLRTIALVLWKYGFGDVAARLGIEGWWEIARRFGPSASRGAAIGFGLALLSWFFTPTWTAYGIAILIGWAGGGLIGIGVAFVRPPQPEYIGLSTEERLRLAFQELGPTYVKFGQILATRPDLMPQSFITELKKLQDDVAPFDSETARQLIEDDLGVQMEEAFSEFNRAPLAAASIAQVHKARLKTGEEVVLKIQRPGIKAQIATDLDLLRILAEIAEESIPEIRRFRPVSLVAEFAKSITKEIDFTNEAHNIQRFARNFKDDPEVHVPKVYDHLTSERVLTMEFIHGIKMTSEEMARHPEIDREKVARTGIRFTLTQTFVHGFFHGDPHPGNIFIMEGNRICLIDYGMMGTIDQERIDELLVFLISILTRNTRKMIRLFLRLGLIDEKVDIRGLKGDIDALIERYWSVDIASIDVGRYIQNLFDVVTRHNIKLPTDLLLMGKALGTIDGVARDIYPELDPVQAIRPYILKVYLRRMRDPSFYLRDYFYAFEEGLLLLQTIPRDLRLILHRMEQGTLTVRTEDPNADIRLREEGRSANRIAMALVIGALILGASYMTVHGGTPIFATEAPTGGYPLVQWAGVAGFILAGFYAIGLLYGIIRSGGQ